MNLTARVGESQTLPFLRDLTHATADLASCRRSRATLPFYLYDDPWELGLLRDGDHVLLTLFRGGTSPEVAIHERSIRGEALVDGLRSALDEQLARPEQARERIDLACARDALLAQGGWRSSPSAEPFWHAIEASSDAPLAFGAELLLRSSADDPPPSVARSDLHPLLVKSRMRVVLHGNTRELGEGFAFLLGERLVELADLCLEAHAQGQAIQRRVEVGRLTLGVRLTDDGSLTLTLRRAHTTPASSGETFPGLSVQAFAQAVVAFGRSLGKALLRNDRAQSQNLRLSSFRASIKRISASLRPRQEVASRLNEAPESYRAYALASQRPAPPQGPDLGRSKLRFVPRWEATIPGLDLAGTFLCGDRLMVTGSREIAAIGRNTGEILWSRPAQRAVAVPTPGGLARIHPDGQVHIHDYGTGEPTLSLRLAPKLGGAASGTVIHAPGLPKLFVVTEGERHLSAIDLVSGEVRWRYTLSRGGTTRLRRAGRLLLEASGDMHMTALDVQSGEVVWRLCTPAPCHTAPAVDHDSLYLVTGDTASARRGRPHLLAVDTWSGALQFEAQLPPRPACSGPPLLTASTVALLTRDDRGTGLMAFDRASGKLRYHLAPGLTPHNASWLAVDDALFANTDQGELLCIDASSGEVRFRLNLCPPPEESAPRKLDPVLRSGALFIPQREVFVVRPRDGELLGQVPSELIPDLLRVDERCDVYLGEESGHMAAFGVGPRLSLVKG